MAKSVLWEWLVNGQSVVVLDVPLLFEGRFDRFCGITIAVATEPELQLQRLMERDARLSKEDAQGRIASQWDINDKKNLADVVIENDSSKETLEQSVAAVFFTITIMDLDFEGTWILRIPPVGFTFASLIFIQRSFRRRSRKKSQ